MQITLTPIDVHTYEINFVVMDLYTVWKLLRFIPTHFWQKFRESNDFTNKEITKELI